MEVSVGGLGRTIFEAAKSNISRSRTLKGMEIIDKLEENKQTFNFN